MVQSNDIQGHAGVFTVNFKFIRLIDMWFSWLFIAFGQKKFGKLHSKTDPWPLAEIFPCWIENCSIKIYWNDGNNITVSNIKRSV